MTLPPLTAYADTLSYDRERGSVRLLDWRGSPRETLWLECADVDALIRALEAAGPHGGAWLALAAGYGLALAARAWGARPSDARRGALIQAAQALRAARVSAAGLTQIVEAGLARADAAVLAGGDAEDAVVGFVGRELARADKVAERCGRIAAGLLDQGDRILAHGFAGPALGWMLHVAVAEQGRSVQLYADASSPDSRAALLTRRQAEAVGVPAALLDGAELAAGLAQGLFTVGIVAAAQIALDGSVAGPAGAAQHAALAKRHRLPLYVVGYAGPDPALPSGGDIPLPQPAPAAAPGRAGPQGNWPGVDIIPPDLIGAIITSRGVYRPEMIARYLGDGDAPLDVIPLAGA